jgi:hypothetical protein
VPKENPFDYNDAMLEAAINQAIAAEREAMAKLTDCLRQKDAAIGVLFDRLAKAGVDCSDLIS